MGISESLKEKVIIIADNDADQAKKISAYLKQHGFINTNFAKDGNKIYAILRSYYFEPEQIGLIIVSEDLPYCDLSEMCMTLSNNEDGTLVPFIILQSNENTSNSFVNENSDFHVKSLIYHMSLPLNLSGLLIAVNFQLRFKQERLLRYKHEDNLVKELAERKIIDAKLTRLVQRDELTGLLNRQSFEGKLQLILKQNQELNHNGALLFLDIDHFSLINELEGFDVGDKLLVEVVSIIRKQITKMDLFARIGSDEFCIYLDNQSVTEMQHFAEQIRKEIYETSFRIAEKYLNITISVGITASNSKKAVFHPTEIISRARQACVAAKENGRDLVWQYSEMHPRVREREREIYWVPIIRNALAKGNFLLFFQPVVNLNSGEISHYETLIRMRGPDNEIATPAEFIPVAERIGLIHRIDRWVVEKAIDFLAALPPNMSHISLAINLSTLAFQDAYLLPIIKEKLKLGWLDAQRITFEITETIAVDKIEQMRDLIMEIRDLGCKFALDDFGAGFCSFNYLKSFPVDYVKIDGQFVKNILSDKTDQILVQSMVEIAHKLGKVTIAEFVETPETSKMLRELGVTLGQGYAFGGPEQKLLPFKTLPINGLTIPESPSTPLHA